VPPGFNALAFVYEGEAYFGENGQRAGKEQAVQLEKEKENDQLIVKTKDKECSFIFFAGEPLGEPVAQHGPFVMNTREELEQAFDDYRNFKNGFENARNWESTIQHMNERRQ